MEIENSEHKLAKIEKEIRVPKTARGRRILKKKEAQIEEPAKQTIFLKGQKTSEEISSLLRDLYTLKKINSINFSRRHEVLPFEEI